MAVLLSPYGGVGAQFLDNAGNVLTGGKIYTYAAGTTTPQVAYGNSAGTTPLNNPIILNAAGRVPTGEIWLTDGLVYKFVLTDSNDVLIATYDNIVGINSNFVAFTNQQEIQTATAGQTVFNLTTMTYQPNTNSLSVFVDGVNQYGPGSSYAYLETDSDTVTFVSGLHVGAEVKFTTSNLNSSTSGNAYNVSYLPPFTGATGTNVGLKLAQIVSFKDFGAVGDGVTDDTTAIQTALNSNALVIDGQKLTYLISAPLTGQSGQTIQNATFTAPSLGTSATLLTFSGTQGTAINVSSNVAAGAFSITVADGSTFTEGGWAFIKSNQYWSPAALDNVIIGELVHIESIASNVLTLQTPTLAAYAVANSATVAPLTTAKNIVLQDVTLKAPVSTGNQIGVKFIYCESVEVRNCNTYDFDHTHLWFERCANYAVRGGASFRTGVQEGLDYGVAHLRGCYNGLVDGYTGNSMRHISTIGGSEGVSRFIRVVNSFGYNLTDGGIDSHSACYEHDFSHNFLLFSNSADVTIEGIVSQGGLLTCIGNTIIGARRHGVAWTPEIADSVTITGEIGAIISKNSFTGNKNVVGTTYAVLVSPQVSATALKPIDGVVISGNLVKNFDGMALVRANTGGKVSNVVIDSNVCQNAMTQRGVYILASNNNIQNVNITNNILKATANEVIYCAGTTPYSVNNINVANNIIDGGSFSLRFLYANKIVTAGNQTINATSVTRVESNVTGLMAYDIVNTVDLSDIRQQVTIASGVVAIDNPIRRIVRVDTEGSAASDDLDTINGGYIGQQIQVMSTNTSRDITCKDGTGNLRLSGDRVLSQPEDVLSIWYDGTVWYEMSFADNNV